MYRTIVDIIAESVKLGHEKGIDRFLETIEHDLNKEAVFEEHGVNSILRVLIEDAGFDVESLDDYTDVSEDKLDMLLSSLEQQIKEG